jgi:hypothetical protein
VIVLWYLRIAQREKPSKSHGRTLRGRLFRILEGDCPRRERQSGRGADQRGLRCCSTPETDPATAPVLPIASRAPREKPEKCRDKKSKGMVGKSIESECLRRERQSGVKLTKRGLRYGTPERPTTHKQQPPPSARQEVFCQATWAFNQGRYARNGHNVNNDGYCIEPDLLTARPPATRKRA